MKAVLLSSKHLQRLTNVYYYLWHSLLSEGPHSPFFTICVHLLFLASASPLFVASYLCRSLIGLPNSRLNCLAFPQTPRVCPVQHAPEFSQLVLKWGPCESVSIYKQNSKGRCYCAATISRYKHWIRLVV